MVKRVTKTTPPEPSETVSVEQPEIRRRPTLHQLILKHAPSLADIPSCEEAHDLALAAQIAKEAPELLQVAASIQRAIAKGERQIVVNLSEYSARYLRDVKRYTVETTAEIRRQMLQLHENMETYSNVKPPANAGPELSAFVAAGSHRIKW